MQTVPQKLLAEQLRRTVEPHSLDTRMLQALASEPGIIGQERAVAALRFGLSIRYNGFNIYVAGPPGIGKMTTVRQFVAEFVSRQPLPADWCYLNNFDDPSRPSAYRLPAGQGRQLQRDMRALVEHGLQAIPNAFETNEYTGQRNETSRRLNAQREALLGEFSERAGRAGFALKLAPFGMMLVPIVQNHPMSDEDFAALPEAERDDFIRRRDALDKELEVVMKHGRELERSTQHDLEELDRSVALSVVGALMDDLDERYRAYPEITTYLAAVRQDILTHIRLFRAQASEEQTEPAMALMTP